MEEAERQKHFGGIEMQEMAISRSIGELRQALEENGYSKGRIQQFSSTTNQLLKFMDQQGIDNYSMDVGMRFIGEHYGFKADGTLKPETAARPDHVVRGTTAWYVYDAAPESELPHTRSVPKSNG